MGDIRITALSDGTVPGDLHALLRGTTNQKTDGLLKKGFVANPVEISINVFGKLLMWLDAAVAQSGVESRVICDLTLKEYQVNKSVSVTGAAAGLQEKWSPRVIAEVDDVYVKVAKVHGQLAWHSHENEDSFFLCSRGTYVSSLMMRLWSCERVNLSSFARVCDTIRSLTVSVISC
jgi:hypothetical protein